jgi:hypothetical protein
MPAKLNFFKTPASLRLVSSWSVSTSTGISGCFQPGQAKVGPSPTPFVEDKKGVGGRGGNRFVNREEAALSLRAGSVIYPAVYAFCGVGVVEDKTGGEGVGGGGGGRGGATFSSIEKKLLSLRRLGYRHIHTHS